MDVVTMQWKRKREIGDGCQRDSSIHSYDEEEGEEEEVEEETAEEDNNAAV